MSSFLLLSKTKGKKKRGAREKKKYYFSSFSLFFPFHFPAKALAPPGPANDDAAPPPPLEAKTPLFPEGPAQAPGPEDTATPFPPLPLEK